MILVCGEALMDVFPGAAEGGGIALRAVAGGSPFNLAVGLARLGVPAGFLGGLSRDFFGRRLAAMLEAEGVSLRCASFSDRLTTLSVVATDAGGAPAYAFHGEGKADRMLGLSDLPAELPGDVAALTFGSYSLAVEPVGSALLALARRERGRRLVSLDPNIRPTVTPDMAAWRARFAEFLACADIVKASDEDIRIAHGADADIDRIAAGWLAAGPRLVVVTRGPAGASAYAAQGRLDVAGRRVAVVDTVGAGDCFHAALLAGLHRRGALTPAALSALPAESLTEALRYAVAASAVVCGRRGADAPRAAEVEAALAAP